MLQYKLPLTFYVILLSFQIGLDKILFCFRIRGLLGTLRSAIPELPVQSADAAATREIFAIATLLNAIKVTINIF